MEIDEVVVFVTTTFRGTPGSLNEVCNGSPVSSWFSGLSEHPTSKLSCLALVTSKTVEKGPSPMVVMVVLSAG